jgi:hypothetical protein
MMGRPRAHVWPGPDAMLRPWTRVPLRGFVLLICSSYLFFLFVLLICSSYLFFLIAFITIALAGTVPINQAVLVALQASTIPVSSRR